MTIVEEALAALNITFPQFICPFQVQIGDLVRFKDEPLDVVITGSELDGVERVLVWETPIRKSDGTPVLEGRGVHEPGETILLLHRPSGGAR